MAPGIVSSGDADLTPSENFRDAAIVAQDSSRALRPRYVVISREGDPKACSRRNDEGHAGLRMA
jgi:hypothetical protein